MATFYAYDAVKEKKTPIGTRVRMDLVNGDYLEILAVGENVTVRSSFGKVEVTRQFSNQVLIGTQS